MYNKAMEEAEDFDTWYPDDNTYTVIISQIKKGVTQKDEGPLVWFKPMLKIIADGDPELNGREFQLGFFSSTRLGGLKTVVKQITQNPDNRDMEKCDTDLTASVGVMMTVRVYQNEGKNGKTYHNVDIIDILKPVDEETSAEVPS